MLDRMNLNPYADKIRNGVFNTYEEGIYLTRDLGGKSSTNEYVKAVIGNLSNQYIIMKINLEIINSLSIKI